MYCVGIHDCIIYAYIHIYSTCICVYTPKDFTFYYFLYKLLTYMRHIYVCTYIYAIIKPLCVWTHPIMFSIEESHVTSRACPPHTRWNLFMERITNADGCHTFSRALLSFSMRKYKDTFHFFWIYKTTFFSHSRALNFLHFRNVYQFLK